MGFPGFGFIRCSAPFVTFAFSEELKCSFHCTKVSYSKESPASLPSSEAQERQCVVVEAERCFEKSCDILLHLKLTSLLRPNSINMKKAVLKLNCVRNGIIILHEMKSRFQREHCCGALEL